jgi:hypothetical protein
MSINHVTLVIILDADTGLVIFCVVMLLLMHFMGVRLPLSVRFMGIGVPWTMPLGVLALFSASMIFLLLAKWHKAKG